MSQPDDIDFDDPPRVTTATEIDFDVAPPAQVEQVAVPMDLVQILPPDFPLPTLVRFVPDQAIKVALDDVVAKALAVEVKGIKGLKQADEAMAGIRVAIRVATEHFDEPKRIAYELHRSITGALGSWVSPAAAALDMVSGRFLAEKKRLEAEEAKRRRKEQEEADEKARADAAEAAARAAQTGAPPDLVAQMQADAAVATAPPVPVLTTIATAVKSTAVAKKWKARLIGTPGENEPHPAMDELTPVQMAEVFRAMKAVVEGRASLIIFDINWPRIDGMAAAQKSTFSLPGFEAYEDQSTRGKPGPKKKP